MDSLISSVLECLMRRELPPLRALEIAGEEDPSGAARALLLAASLEELAASRASWVPALMVSGRPGLGATWLYQLAMSYIKQTGERLDPARMPALALVLGSSERIGQQLVDNPEWADDLVGDPPPPPDLHGSAPSFEAIRESQARGMLSAVARELIGCPLETTFAELTGLAEVCLETALQCAGDDTGVTPPAMFGLGQFGGCELGLSPAVDLLFIDTQGHAAGSKRAGERLAEIDTLLAHLQRGLSAGPECGVSYRLDFSERPRGVVALGVAPALDYFSNEAPPGERRLFERIRPLRADPSLARELISSPARGSGPRRRMDVVEAELKYRAEREAVRPADDLVRGVGGVCDLEAIVHVLWAAGSEPRTTGDGQTLLAALHQLGASGAISADASVQLADAYAWLRRAEHALQLIESNASGCLPADPQGQIVLARCMGYREPEASRARERLIADRQEIRQAVLDQFEICVLEPAR